MARNSERAMLLLNRWQTMKSAINRGITGKRPRNVDEIATVKEAEFWRNNLVREVSKAIAEVQNAGLGEERIRDLNDHINRLLREKTRWELQIRDLGGPDYKASSAAMFDSFGTAVTVAEGYRYFGAAQELTVVKDFIARQQEVREASKAKRTRAAMFQNIKPDYFAWREPEELAQEEEQLEKEAREALLEEWEARNSTNPIIDVEHLRATIMEDSGVP